MDLKEKLKSLPSLPGVYLMKDSQGSIIYVGKSKNLKNRVRSYFQNSKSRSPKVEKLTNHLKDFEYILTDTEFETFLLECKLIKENKPIYNKLMKSPISYLYINISINEKSPYIRISNECNKDDENLYFGPYTNKNTVETGLSGIKECCRILCNNNLKRSSLCLNYSLGMCIGMCDEDADVGQYIHILHRIIMLLNGYDKSILNEMENMMKNAAERFVFEDAARYRDYIKAVNYLVNGNKVIKFTEENNNIVLLEYLSQDTFKLFLIRGNRVLFTEKYSITGFEPIELRNLLKNNILLYFKIACMTDPVEVNKEEIDQAQIIYNYLKKRKNNLRYFVISDIMIEDHKHEYIDGELNKLLGI